jgi:hypothetical protein
LVEEWFGRLTTKNCVRDEIGLTLVVVAWLINRAVQRYAMALLHNMRCFMRGKTEIWLRGECNLSVGCERLRTEFPVRVGSAATHMRTDTRDVVTPKACLDLCSVR